MKSGTHVETRFGLAEPEELVPDPVLKDEHHEAVGRADGEQVEDDRLQREHDRPECDGQQDEAEDEHERDDPGKPVGHQRGVVDLLGGLAGHEDRRVHVAEQRRARCSCAAA